MKAKNTKIKTLEQFKDLHYGKPGAVLRAELEVGYESFKIGAMIQDARLRKGLHQVEIAEKLGITKSVISKIENNEKKAA